MFTFVTGGLRSGKSAYSLRRASELGQPPWLYIAPNAEGDEDLKARLAGYRRDQDARWKLIEAPELLWSALEPETIDHHGAVVLDRFTIWLSKYLAKVPQSTDREFLLEIEKFSDRLYRSMTPVVLVTTEIGLGFLPSSVPDRRLINVAGQANQILAERAQTVVMMVSGVPLRLR